MRTITAGTGFMGAGIFLVIAGAILKFAVTVSSATVNVNLIGLIVLIAGGVTFFVGLGLTLIALSRRDLVAGEALPPGMTVRSGYTSTPERRVS